jgi:hypothetical protein
VKRQATWLALWYVELALLALCRYDGKYVTRIQAGSVQRCGNRDGSVAVLEEMMSNAMTCSRPRRISGRGLPGAVDTKQSAREGFGPPEYGVDSCRLADEVRIKRADNDAGMVGAFLVETNEVLAIEREERPCLSAGEREHLIGRHCLASSARFDDGQDIVAQLSQFQDNGERKVLVGVSSRHDRAASFSSI